MSKYFVKLNLVFSISSGQNRRNTSIYLSNYIFFDNNCNIFLNSYVAINRFKFSLLCFKLPSCLKISICICLEPMCGRVLHFIFLKNIYLILFIIFYFIQFKKNCYRFRTSLFNDYNIIIQFLLIYILIILIYYTFIIINYKHTSDYTLYHNIVIILYLKLDQIYTLKNYIQS